ncbi:MAG: isomerizing glutamine--fructose-6-phosphate transaminase, partial [Bacteroidota bacterium]
MCGIVAYIGQKEAYPILIKGLRRLEYRGYDSAGIALQNGDLHIYKKKGKVQELVDFAVDKDITGTAGIGHTRWATHGKPDDVNAHPHTSGNGRLTLVHNGIIENYTLLKKALEKEGHIFETETDTEVLIHLIEEVQNRDNLPLEEAVRVALSKVNGAYAIVVMDKNDPDKLVGARKASPLVIGIGKDEFYLASDATPIVEYTKQVVYLNDEEIAVVNRSGDLEIKTIANEKQTPFVQELNMQIEMLEKGGYDYFMLKEIHEQPKTIADCMRGRVNAQEGWVRLGGVEQHSTRIAQANRFIIVACGTSWHAGLIAEYVF